MTANPTTVQILLCDRDLAVDLSARLVSLGIGASACGSGDDLLTSLRSGRVDVVVLSQRQSGFLQGLEIVDRLQKELLHPEVVLTGDLSPAERETARELGIKVLLGEDCRLPELLSAVGLCAAHRDSEPQTTPAAARRLIAGMDDIQPMPHVLGKICASLRDDVTSLATLADDISVDPRVTAELLKLSNSTATGLSRRVSSVHDAVSLLGVRRTAATVMGAAISQAQSRLARTIPESIRQWYQTRSVLIASTAACFAEKLERISSDTAHVLGLFQDLGMLVLAQARPRLYEQLWQRATQRGHVRIECLEREEFGVTHADVSAALLEHWALPSSLVRLVLDHHPPERQAELTEVERAYLHVMRIAEAVANLGDVRSPHRHQVLRILLARYGVTRSEECKACIAVATARAREFAKLFSTPPPDENVLRSILAEVEALAPEQTNPPADPMDFAEEEPPSPPAGRFVEPGFRCGRQVLVIDDDPGVLQTIQRQLEPEGYDVHCCQEASEAPDLAHGKDVILCDVHLGSHSGVDLVTQLRDAGIDAPILILSGDRSRETVFSCVNAGIADYIVKPFTKRDLVEKLDRALQHHLAREANARDEDFHPTERTTLLA